MYVSHERYDNPSGSENADLIVSHSPPTMKTVATQNLTVMVSIFHVPPRFVEDPVNTELLTNMLREMASDTELCGGRMPQPASHVRTRTFHSIPVGNNRFYAHARMQYKVKQSGLHSVIMEVCSSYEDWGVLDATTKIKGTMEFRNPYGYLSGIFFGYLPFEGGRAVIFFIFAIIYFTLLCAHRSGLMVVHYSIMAVVVIAFAEALTWFVAYEMMNTDGQPYCCPFPKAVIAAMVFKMLRRTLSRTLLLVICMGYGIARPSLTKREIIAVAVLSLCYLVASVTVDAHDLVEINDLHRTTPHHIG